MVGHNDESGENGQLLPGDLNGVPSLGTKSGMPEEYGDIQAEYCQKHANTGPERYCLEAQSQLTLHDASAGLAGDLPDGASPERVENPLSLPTIKDFTRVSSTTGPIPKYDFNWKAAFMVESKRAESDPRGSARAPGFYLKPKTKVWLLAVCLVLMVGASVFSMLQPLNPDPLDTQVFSRIWYPHETNISSRLQAVTCADEYACRLNSVAVNGNGDLPEVWAVGNVGLVLHRPAGKTGWERLSISATEETAAVPESNPTSPPPPVPYAPLQEVPNLLGLTQDHAANTAASSGFLLEVEYENGADSKSVVQQAPPSLIVLRQSPRAGTQVPEKSTIKVTLGSPPKSKAELLLDQLIPTAYAAVPEKEPKKASPPSAANTTTKNSSLPRPNASISVDDDLIYVNCIPDQKECMVLGRSGRVFRIQETGKWTFRQASFAGIKGSTPRLSFASNWYPTSWASVIAQSDENIYLCLNPSKTVRTEYVCTPDRFGGKITGDNVFINNADQIKNAAQNKQPPTIFEISRRDSEQQLSVGDSGFIASVYNHSDEYLEQIKPIQSGTKASLRSLAIFPTEPSPASQGTPAPIRYYIVGDHGTILSSADGGDTWRHETQGAEGTEPNHRLPAPWYWTLAFLLIGASALVVATPPPPQSSDSSVADWTFTDAPLKPGDVDSLGFTPMALGLSRFIRNPKTQPPVTIAIEGVWGSGKSSVMSLLCGDLKKSRFRPVWFNAWHHQSEEQLLAALMEHVKEQAIPPWWHIDNWIFRARLVHFRFRKKWPLMVVLVLALCGSVAFEISSHGLPKDDIVNSGNDLINLIKHLIPSSAPKGEPYDFGHFGLVATVIATIVAIIKKAKVFGIDPAKLTDNLRNAATIKNVKPDPGIRPRFAREFGDICTAWSWGGRRVIIFIDDLDRCRPESVVTVLESINFLTTAGDCMIVLGLAQNQVIHAVGLGFSNIAEAEADYEGKGNTARERAVGRFKYGELYIRKLVNIFAHLPETTPEQRRRVLEVRAAEMSDQLDLKKDSASKKTQWRVRLWDWTIQIGRVAFRTVPILGLVLAVVLSVSIGYKQGIPKTEVPPPDKPKLNATVIEQTTSESVAKPLVYSRPTSEAATLVQTKTAAGGVWWSFAVDALLLLVLFGVLTYQLSARTNQDAQNSLEFNKSLDLWGQYIVSVCDTPREIKRALNDLRYQAMTRRTNGPSTTRGERLTRALRQFVTGRIEKRPSEMRIDDAALPPLKAAEFASLTPQEFDTFLSPKTLGAGGGSENLQLLMKMKEEHIRIFGHWIGEVKLEQTLSPDSANSPA